MNLRAACLLAAVTCFAADAASAQIYKWVDRSGVVHFADTPPFRGRPSDKLEVIRTDRPHHPIVTGAPTPASSASGRTFRPPPARSRPRKALADVELYVTQWCPFCRRAREFLKARGVPFVEYDVDADPAAARRRDELSGESGVPVALIGDRVVRGFSRVSYERALKEAGW